MVFMEEDTCMAVDLDYLEFCLKLLFNNNLMSLGRLNLQTESIPR